MNIICGKFVTKDILKPATENLDCVESKILQKVSEKFNEFTLGQTNEMYKRYVFNSYIQEEQEFIDAYVNVLRNLVKWCNFCKKFRSWDMYSPDMVRK